jgi:hypothetical protein
MLATYAVYAFRIGSHRGLDSITGRQRTERRWLHRNRADEAVVTCLVYLVTLGLAARFVASVRAAHAAGYIEFQYKSTSEAFLSLIPESSTLALGLFCCVLVHAYFRSRGELWSLKEVVPVGIQFERRRLPCQAHARPLPIVGM